MIISKRFVASLLLAFAGASASFAQDAPDGHHIPSTENGIDVCYTFSTESGEETHNQYSNFLINFDIDGDGEFELSLELDDIRWAHYEVETRLLGVDDAPYFFLTEKGIDFDALDDQTMKQMLISLADTVETIYPSIIGGRVMQGCNLF